MLKRLITTILILILSSSFVLASEVQKVRASMESDFILNETGDITFVTHEDLKVNDEINIPAGSVVYAKNIQAQRALRWHKSGCILCQIMKYSPNEFTDETIDLSDKELYFVARKYEKIYKKDAAIITTEILVTQGASFFAPGADILYFFTKGAIIREKHPNWFRAGVSNAYENSICWFWLKGKTINLNYGDDINLKSIEKVDAVKLKKKMVKRKTREDLKALKKELYREFKETKKAEIAEIKQLKKELKEEEKFAKENPIQNEVMTDGIIEIMDVHAAAKTDEI